jgi:hypothetical protein
MKKQMGKGKVKVKDVQLSKSLHHGTFTILFTFIHGPKGKTSLYTWDGNREISKKWTKWYFPTSYIVQSKGGKVPKREVCLYLSLTDAASIFPSIE